MTRVDLKTLLDKNQICHPTGLVGISASNGDMKLSFEGVTWWREGDLQLDGKITFVFIKPNSGGIDADLFLECGDPEADEMLEDFFITDTEPGSLSAFPYICLYASSPLPDPQSVYLKVDDYLRELYTYKRPGDFLNCGGAGLEGFVGMTQASGYLIARGPGAICDIICRELENQGIAFYHSDDTATRKNSLFIRWRGSMFECEAAYAEFD